MHRGKSGGRGKTGGVCLLLGRKRHDELTTHFPTVTPVHIKETTEFLDLVFSGLEEERTC